MIPKQNCCQFILDSFWLGGWIIWKHNFSWWHLIWLCLKEGKRDNCFKTFQLFEEKTNTNLRRRGLVSMFEYLTTWDRSLRTLPDIGRNFICETWSIWTEYKINLKVIPCEKIVIVYATECSVLIEDKSDFIVSGRMPQSVANLCLCSLPSILEADCGHPIGKTAFFNGMGDGEGVGI